MQGSDNPSQFEMGMSSMLVYLDHISRGTDEGNRFLGKISETIEQFLQNAANYTQSTFTTMSVSYQKLHYMVANRSLSVLEQIMTGVHAMVNKVHRDRQTPDKSDDTKKSFRVGGKGDTFIDKQLNVHFAEKMSEKDIKNFEKFFLKMHEFVNTPKDKFDAVNGFYKDLGDNLQTVNKYAFKAAFSITLLAASFFLLSFVSLTGIVKFVLVMGVLGIGIGLFVKRLVKSFSGTGIIKTFLILRTLPDLFEGIGKGVLMMSLGLMFFNYVGYEAMFKLISTLFLMGLSFKMFTDSKGEFVGTFMLLSLGVAVFVFAEQMIKVAKVPWDGVGKIAGFVISLGLALRIARFDRVRSFMNNPLTILSLSIGLLTLNLLQYKNVDWSSIMKVGVFIATVGLSLKVFNRGSGFSPMTVFAIGMMLMTLAFADFQELDILAIVQMIGVIGMLGVTLNFFIRKLGIGRTVGNFTDMGGIGDAGGSTGLIGFAFGLAFMALAMYALSEVPIAGIWKTIVFVAGLAFVLKLFGTGGPGKKMNSMWSFGLGIAIMTLAMYAMDELPWEAMFKTLTFIIGLGLAIRIMNGRGTPPLVRFAFGLGIMVLAMYAMEEVPWETVFKTIIFIGALGLVLKLFGKTGALSMLAVSASLVVFVWALEKFKKSKFSIEDSMSLGLAMIVIGGFLAIIGIPAVAALVGLGALVMIGIGIALYITAISLKKINDMEMKAENILMFFGAVTVMALGFAALSFIMMPAIIGSALFIVVGLAALLGAEALAIIGNSEYNNSSINNFMLGVSALAVGFMENSLKMIPAAVAALLFIPVAIAALMGAGVLHLIAKIDINQKQLDKYNFATNQLVDNINEYGLISLGKSALKAVALLPIYGAMYLGALLLNKISNVTINKQQVEIFGNMLTYLTDVVLVSLTKNEDKMEKAKPGLEALAKLLSVSKGLADTIQLMANLKFYEYEVQNGKLVLKGVRQLTSNDFKAVGQNIGIMLDTLIKPLEILGGSSNSFKIGGMLISNPFKNDKTLKGIELMTRMSTAYKPLSESIKIFADSKIMKDQGSIDIFSGGLKKILGIYIWFFNKTSEVEDKPITDVIEYISDLNSSIKDLSTDQIKDFNNMFVKFVDLLVNESKWKKIQKNLVMLRREFGLLSKSINNIDIDKAEAFQSNIEAFTKNNNSRYLAEAAESLKEILGMVQNNQTTYVAPDNGSSSMWNDWFSSQDKKEPTKQPTKQSGDSEIIQQLTAALNQVTGILSAIDGKLGGTLKVKMLSGAGNTI